MFVFQVRKAGRFIEDNNGRIFQNCPRNANSLLFSARQLYAVLAQFSFVAIRKAHNKIVNLRSFGRGLYLLGRSFFVSNGDIFINTVMQRKGFLKYKGHQVHQIIIFQF